MTEATSANERYLIEEIQRERAAREKAEAERDAAQKLLARTFEMGRRTQDALRTAEKRASEARAALEMAQAALRRVEEGVRQHGWAVSVFTEARAVDRALGSSSDAPRPTCPVCNEPHDPYASSHACPSSDAPAPIQEECDRCDGCGWYEGGKTLQTTCEQCGGTGAVLVTNEDLR